MQTLRTRRTEMARIVLNTEASRNGDERYAGVLAIVDGRIAKYSCKQIRVMQRTLVLFRNRIQIAHCSCGLSFNSKNCKFCNYQALLRKTIVFYHFIAVLYISASMSNSHGNK